MSPESFAAYTKALRDSLPEELGTVEETSRFMGLMTPIHPRWKEFAERLEGAEGCNFRKEAEETKWDCASGSNKEHSIAILRAMGASPVDIFYSIQYFDSHGGHCDCEILFNIDLPYRNVTRRRNPKVRKRDRPKEKTN